MNWRRSLAIARRSWLRLGTCTCVSSFRGRTGGDGGCRTGRARPQGLQLDAKAIKAAGHYDGKFLVHGNDDTLSAEDKADALRRASLARHAGAHRRARLRDTRRDVPDPLVAAPHPRARGHAVAASQQRAEVVEALTAPSGFASPSCSEAPVTPGAVPRGLPPDGTPGAFPACSSSNLPQRLRLRSAATRLLVSAIHFAARSPSTQVALHRRSEGKRSATSQRGAGDRLQPYLGSWGARFAAGLARGRTSDPHRTSRWQRVGRVPPRTKVCTMIFATCLDALCHNEVVSQQIALSRCQTRQVDILDMVGVVGSSPIAPTNIRAR